MPLTARISVCKTIIGAIEQFEETRLLDVAMNRATLWLGPSSRWATPLIERVRAQLKQLQVEWSDMG
ncbi:hypothetical protein [Variovorax sp. PBL-E5]|uniref:hypothetical protein n=1 Tax=Variovorax sp. PBL-E5 TaxID=434014 RepID=UPI0013190317|nr:hypothetical protein [Variovorax sp. PBL-E5]VTU39708.1 hypothetical protein E5CHR_05178 [Variovorax sp. PBL-E5]